MLNVGQSSADGISYENYGAISDAKKKENRAAKTCRYPLKRLESTSDYLMIKVLEYKPPGLEIGAGKEITTKEVNGEIVQRELEDIKYEGPSDINIGSVPANERLNLKKLKYLMYLPVPQYVTDNNSVTWGEDRLDPLAAFGLSFGVDALQNPINAVTQYFETGKQKLSSMIQDEGTKRAFISAVAGSAYGALGGNVTPEGILARATGQILNPNMELLFQGPNVRTFSSSKR